MDKLFDDISRIVASPVPRRRALRFIVSGLAGATLAAFGFERAEAAPPCPPSQTCGSKCCKTTEKCCANTACCAGSTACCQVANGSGKCCKPGEVCCSGKCQKPGPSPNQPCG